MKNTMLAFAAIAATLALTACDLEQQQSAEKKQAVKTQQLQAEADRQIGMPDIVNFQERRFAKQILEMRDKAIATYTYTVDMNGRKHFLCSSVGYGLPYAVQYTNPMVTHRSYQGGFEILPQADPNGLYMPADAQATWVLCSDGKGGVMPVYSEPQILVSPFKMDAE